MTCKGVILYEGKSVLTKDPIVAIATFKSKNTKTGSMIQTWVMRSDINPVEASKKSMDKAVCGNCPQRHSLKGSCYVVLGQAPLMVWNTYKKSVYPSYSKAAHARFFIGHNIRICAYGDPAAVPYKTWSNVLSLTKAHTGYTHARRHKNFDRRIADICMVSVDTPQEARRAQLQGYSTYRTKLPTERIEENEFLCLNTYNKNIVCNNCLLCAGRDNPNIVINVHGSRANNWRNLGNKRTQLHSSGPPTTGNGHIPVENLR